MPDFLALKSAARGERRLAPPLTISFADPEKYKHADGLVEALDAAMLVGIPLLLTGEPGTGKTSAAEWFAHRYEFRLLRYDVKSTSAGRDLLYAFDEVARFRDAAAAAEPQPLINYVRFSALGEAIIRSMGGAAPLELMKPDARAETAKRAFGKENAPLTAASLLPSDTDFAAAEPEHCVVLIDELDKAPRDTPNDLLAEVARMAFHIPELGLSVGPAPKERSARPIILITSNSEKGLPEPFLRRCAYFDIPPPKSDVLATIVGASFPAVTEASDLFAKAHFFYAKVRNEDWIRKKPGTAELLAWIGYNIGERADEASKTFDVERARVSLGCLLKTADDLKQGQALFKSHFG